MDTMVFAAGQTAMTQATASPSSSTMTADLAVALPISNGVTSEPLFDHALMAKAYLSEGRFDEAERLYVLALKVSEEVYGSTHVEVIPHLENLTSFYLNRAKYEEARPHLERLYGMLVDTRHSQVNPEAVVTVVENLALVLEKLSLSDRCEKLYLNLLRTNERDFGGTHNHTLDALGRLGDYYARTGVYVAARAVFEELLEVKGELLGNNSIELSLVLSSLADVYGKLGLSYDRVRTLERQVEITDTAHGGTGVTLAAQLVRLADALSAVCKQYQSVEFGERAELTYCRALSIYEKSSGANTPTVQGLRAKLLARRTPV